MIKNIDEKVVEDFGKEWKTYTQENKSRKLDQAFQQYFNLLPNKFLTTHSIGFDAGCGSGRWAKYIAPKVKHLYCFDPSNEAIDVARRNLSNLKNCSFECASINSSSIEENSMDFGYCLGVLHHLPDTKKALKSCVSKLKKGKPLLIYIYYSFDNKPSWYKLIWQITDINRKIISKLPFFLKLFLTKLIAFFIYFPLARIALILEKFRFDVSNFPLSDYRRKSFYLMFTDSLDRFGTKLEKRFSKKEINQMMKECGLQNIKFSESMPHWVAIGYKL